MQNLHCIIEDKMDDFFTTLLAQVGQDFYSVNENIIENSVEDITNILKKRLLYGCSYNKEI
jgi:hypothetical protein